MAKYTTQVRSIVESGYKIFDFEYPIFDESYRSVLEQKIIDSYYFREIGFETVGQFKHFLKSKLNVIMPYYNKLYETEGLVTTENYNINLDNKITKTNTITQEQTGTSTSSGTAKNTDVFSDTPQAKLDGKDYATNLTENDGTSSESSSSTGNATTTEEYIEHLLGNGSMRYNADILQEWRNTFLNVDAMIIDELNELFMNIY